MGPGILTHTPMQDVRILGYLIHQGVCSSQQAEEQKELFNDFSEPSGFHTLDLNSNNLTSKKVFKKRLNEKDSYKHNFVF